MQYIVLLHIIRDLKQQRRRRRQRNRGLEKLHSHFLNKLAIISTHLVCVMLPNYPGAKASGTLGDFIR